MIARYTASQFGLAYVAALVALLVLDGIWLGFLMGDFYKREMAEVMTDPVRPAPAVAFYLLYPLALVYLGLSPPAESWAMAAFRCGVVGLVGYGTYNLTCWTLMRGWTAQLSLVDMAWGTLASAAAGAIAWRVAGGSGG